MAIGIQSMGRVHFAGLGLDFNSNLQPTAEASNAAYYEQGSTLLADGRGVPTAGSVVASWVAPVLMGAGGLFLAHKGFKKSGTALVVLSVLSTVFGAGTVTQAYATRTPMGV